MITVCLASYNGEKYIESQLRSILVQLGKDDEVIISDDCSKDNTIEIIKTIDDPRISVFINNAKHGYTSNFENALKHANGDRIILSDQDDIWVENKVSIIIDDLKYFDFVVTDAKIVDKNLNVLYNSFWTQRKPYFSKWGDFMKCAYLGCCMAFNRNVLTKALPFPSNKDLCVHDYWLMSIASFYFKVKYEKSPLTLYRRHGNNVSDGGLSKGLSFFGKIQYRIYVIFHLLLRL